LRAALPFARPRDVPGAAFPSCAMSLIREFVGFLKKFGVLSLAVGVLLGQQVNNVEKALVDDVVMPLVERALPSGHWETAVVQVAGASMKVGHLLEAVLHFVLVALTVFLVARLASRGRVDADALVKDAVAP
jgi:large conductance mechanosensitive channel